MIILSFFSALDWLLLLLLLLLLAAAALFSLLSSSSSFSPAAPLPSSSFPKY